VSARPSWPPHSATPRSAVASASTSSAATGSSNGSGPHVSTTATTSRCASCSRRPAHHRRLRAPGAHELVLDGESYRQRQKPAVTAANDQPLDPPTTNTAIIPTPTLTPRQPVPCHWRTGGPIELAHDSEPPDPGHEVGHAQLARESGQRGWPGEWGRRTPRMRLATRLLAGPPAGVAWLPSSLRERTLGPMTRRCSAPMIGPRRHRGR
jgi:hypothetical protein